MPLFSYEDLYSESNNLPKTRGLFHEVNKDGPLSVSRREVPGKIKLYDIYMDHCVNDPSEVSFAEAVFGDLIYWKALTEDKWFIKHLTDWRMAATEKRKSVAFTAIIKEVRESGKSAFTAAKYLIEEPWLVGATATEKKEIAKNRRISAEKAYSSTAFQEDMTRLREEGILQ